MSKLIKEKSTNQIIIACSSEDMSSYPLFDKSFVKPLPPSEIIEYLNHFHLQRMCS
jgi:hypothetical protein